MKSYTFLVRTSVIGKFVVIAESELEAREKLFANDYEDCIDTDAEDISEYDEVLSVTEQEL